MISLFRNFFQSKIGLPIFIGFLLIVALAFAATDISGSATFGGLTGDENVAVVGDEEISSNEMRSALDNALDRARQENPTITMQQFIESGGLENEVELLIDRRAISEFAERYGLRAGENLVNSEILQIAAFRNLTGEFDQATYQAALRRQNLTDAELRADIAAGLLAQQVLRPALATPQLPIAAARQYARLVLERRQGAIALIPSLQYAPQDDPNDEQLAQFYSANQDDFILPERRTIRVATFDGEDVSAQIEPTSAQIAAYYEANEGRYEAQERRSVSSFVVPTQDAANALAQRIDDGLSLEAAAREAGFQISAGELRDEDDLASATSEEFARNVFAAAEGEAVDPARSQLGWYVARVDDVEQTPARSLDEAREEITQQLQSDARAAALADLSSTIEDMVDDGTSLSEVARQFDLETRVVPGVTADGRLFGSPGQTIDDQLRPILETVFQMDESEPQLAVLEAGAQFLIFDVSDITQSAAPPLAEVRDEVEQVWRIERGSEAAREVADEVLAAVRDGVDLSDAMRDAEIASPQVQQINLTRRELAEARDQRIPAPLVLLFSMAQGSTKILEDRNNLGWFVIDLNEIEAEPVDADSPIVAQTRDQLAPALIAEYNQQLTEAVRAEVGVERNAEAIANLRRTLSGSN